METETLLPEQKESIMLKRNFKGEFAWEIKVKDDPIDDLSIKKLKALNETLEVQYGNQGD